MGVTAAAVQEDAGGTRARVLAAARDGFAARGFHATTVDEIARLARCSKKTVYKLFRSKEELFAAVLRGLRAEVARLSVPEAIGPEAALRGFLLAMAGVLLRDTSVALTRIAMAEAGRISSFSPRREPVGARLAQPALEEYLDVLQRGGAYDFGPAPEAARMLIGMALGAFHHELLIGLAAEVPEAAVEARVAHTVRVFLRGSRRRAGADR